MLVLLLSACTEEEPEKINPNPKPDSNFVFTDYEETDEDFAAFGAMIGSEKIYRRKYPLMGGCYVVSETLFSIGTSDYYRYLGCPNFFVKIDGEYVEVFEYIEATDLSQEQIIASGMVYEYSHDKLYETLGINYENITIDNVVVTVKNGEISTGEINQDLERVNLDIEIDDIDDLLDLMFDSETGAMISICRHESMCKEYGPSPEIKIHLTDGESDFVIEIDDGRRMTIELISTSNNNEYFYARRSANYEDVVSPLLDVINEAFDSKYGD